MSIIECYKDFRLMTNSYFPQLIQGSDPIEKKTLVKWILINQGRWNKKLLMEQIYH